MSADEPPRLDEDTRTLLASVQHWAQRNLPAPASGHGGPECQWCPLCQLASMLRGENPDVAEGLTESLASLTSALRALLDTVTGAATSPQRRPAPRPRPRPGRVQQIRLDDPA